MIFKKIGNMENVEVICHYFGLLIIYLRPNAAISVQKSRPRQCLILTRRMCWR